MKRYHVLTTGWCDEGFELLGTYDTQEEAKERARWVRGAAGRFPVAVLDIERERFILNLRPKRTQGS